MSIEIVLEGKLEKETQREQFSAFLKKQCEDLETYEQRVKEILLMMMAEATAVFEKLPCLLDAEILRNILYSGVWSKYNKIQKERQEKRENHGK